MYKLENYSELPSTPGIYFITNILNKKYYFGRAKNLRKRLSKHCQNNNSNIHLQNAIQKYGKENFVIKITEYPNITLLELKEIEQKLLDKHWGLPLCYNISPFANGGWESGENHPNYGKKLYNNGIKNRYFSPNEEIPDGYIIGGLPISDEHRHKISKALTGENNPCYGRTLEKHPFWRQNHSEESKQKQSLAQKSINYKRNIRVIVKYCCYFSRKDALADLQINSNKFYKLFEKEPKTGFYILKSNITECLH